VDFARRRNHFPLQPGAELGDSGNVVDAAMVGISTTLPPAERKPEQDAAGVKSK
jgi:hypothetical protein